METRCFSSANPGEQLTKTTQEESMASNLRLRTICIDCCTDDLTQAVSFWADLLGLQSEGPEAGADGDPARYAALRGTVGHPRFLLQKVDHAPRVHLDFDSDDPVGEEARIVALGGKVVSRQKDWTVMEAPTGHRFCIMASGD